MTVYYVSYIFIVLYVGSILKPRSYLIITYDIPVGVRCRIICGASCLNATTCPGATTYPGPGATIYLRF